MTFTYDPPHEFAAHHWASCFRPPFLCVRKIDTGGTKDHSFRAPAAEAGPELRGVGIRGWIIHYLMYQGGMYRYIPVKMTVFYKTS